MSLFLLNFPFLLKQASNLIVVIALKVHRLLPSPYSSAPKALLAL